MPRYSDGLMLVWNLAAVEATHAGSAHIEPGQLLVALAKVGDLPLSDLVREDKNWARLPALKLEIAEVVQLFVQVRLDARRFRRRLRAQLGRGETQEQKIVHRSAASLEAFKAAENFCAIHDLDVVRPIHLLNALCGQDTWHSLLRECHVDPIALHHATQVVGQRELVPAQSRSSRQSSSGASQSSTPTLEKYGRDLTAQARDNRLVSVTGRSDELRRLTQILLQHGSRSTILVGEPGVGKTSVVEGLAVWLSSAQAPAPLRDKRIIELSLSALVAGTSHRGDFEERLQKVIEEASQSNIVLFIDEIHALVGAGSSSAGAMDAASVLKPALARGEICCIGATTEAEYRRFIESDPALRQRFQLIRLSEPSRDETIDILRARRSQLQEHHGLSIEDEALVAAVELSVRYASSQRLPRKAVQLLDEACAGLRLKSFSDQTQPGVLRRSDVLESAASIYETPALLTVDSEANRLLSLETQLGERVKGQNEAVVEVCKTIRVARTGLGKKGRPQGVFLFVGPTGTGKTELAKALAESLFGRTDRLIRIDMSEYGQEHSVARLIGAPPGYVGHEAGGQLTNAVHTHPHSVVLLDEIEKAHPEIYRRLFLPVFDEGRLTDGQGRLVSFSESVIIMTSNLGVPATSDNLGFVQREAQGNDKILRERIEKKLREAMPPELLNRISNVVFFKPLTVEAIREIIDKILAGIRPGLGEHGLTLSLDESAYDLLMQHGYSEAFSARAMERTVYHLMAEPLSRLILENRFASGTRLLAHDEDGAIIFTAN